jgi:hypothetical protein
VRNEGGHQSWVLRNFDKCIGEEGWREFVGQSVSVRRAVGGKCTPLVEVWNTGVLPTDLRKTVDTKETLFNSGTVFFFC